MFSVSITYTPFCIVFATLSSILPSNLLYPSGALVSVIVYVSSVVVSVISTVPKLSIPFAFVASLSSPFTLNTAPGNTVSVPCSFFTISTT